MSLVDLNGNPIPSGNKKEGGKNESDNNNKVFVNIVIDGKDLENLQKKGFIESFKKYLNQLPKYLYGLSNYFDIKKFYVQFDDNSSNVDVEKESEIRLVTDNFSGYKEDEKSGEDESSKDSDDGESGDDVNNNSNSEDKKE